VRRAKDLVERLRSRTEFWRIGFADGDRACTPHPLDNNIVFGGDVVFIEW
jgi:hypothetical protein